MINSTPAFVLTDAEEIALSSIRSILVEAGFPSDNLVTRRTEKYLTVESSGNYPFCRLKLRGDPFYISLCIGSARDISRLSAMPQYAALNRSTDKFTRFEVESPSDISRYVDGIISAYCFICKIPNRSGEVAPKIGGASPELSAFFGMIENYSSGSMRYKISENEISFFAEYLKALSNSGLDFTNFRPYRTASGGINICGGCIKLQGRKTFMIYFPNGEIPSCRVDNRTLPEYIELQRHWIDFALKHRDLISK